MAAEVPLQDNTSEVAQLAGMAREWIATHCAVKPVHDYQRDSAVVHWTGMSELGWTGIAVGESHGGSGLGLAGMGVLLAEVGRELVPVPLLSSSLLAAYALSHTSLNTRRSALLSGIATGAQVGAVAIDAADMRPGGEAATAAPDAAGGWRLHGVKRFVMDGAHADFVLVEAQVQGQSALFVVERPQLRSQRLDLVDGRDHARIDLTDVVVPEDARLDGGAALCARLRDLARVGLASEMVGACERAIEITVEYLKVREQFGRRIGSFQALQHRAALMVVDLELARSCVEAAWAAAENEADNLGELAALAKFMAGEAMHRASNEIVQMHGGIGMTEAFVAGRYLKWSRVTETLYGNASQLADHYAALKRY